MSYNNCPIFYGPSVKKCWSWKENGSGDHSHPHPNSQFILFTFLFPFFSTFDQIRVKKNKIMIADRVKEIIKDYHRRFSLKESRFFTELVSRRRTFKVSNKGAEPKMHSVNTFRNFFRFGKSVWNLKGSSPEYRFSKKTIFFRVLKI